jgi:hypothetical protein
MAKLDPLKVLLGPLAGGTIYDSPAAHLFGIKDPEEVRRLRAAEEAEAEKKAAAAKSGMKPAGGMKRGGTVKKMASGGMPSIEESLKSGNRVSEQVGKETKKLMPPKKRTMPSPGESVKSGNRMSGEDAKDLKAVKKYAKGGSVSSRGDGCAVRGKTKGKMV